MQSFKHVKVGWLRSSTPRILSRHFCQMQQATQPPKIELKSHYGLWINGEFVNSQSQQTFDVENPHNGETLCTVSAAQPEDIDIAVRNGYDTFHSGIWSNMDVRDRSEILYNSASLLRKHVYDIAYMESLQTGRPLREMNAQLQRLPEWLEYYGALIRTTEGRLPPFKGKYLNYVKRVPLGLVAQITPWNHPMLIAIKKIAPALAAGNCIIVKPSELAPCSVLEFGQILKDSGLPNGVLNIIPGIGKITGKHLIDQKNFIKKIDLTGGTETGMKIGSIAGNNLMYYTAELGGKAPIIIFKDYIMDDNITGKINEKKLEQVVNGCCFASYIASGQTCIMGARLLIEDSIYDIIIEKLKTKIETSVKMNINNNNNNKENDNSPQNLSTQFGPVICKSQRDKIINFMEIAKNEGARIITGGKIPNDNNNPNKNGYYFEPTLIGDCRSNMKIVQEEVFGPVVVALKFSSEKEAINLANDSPYGLAAAIWTNSISKGYRVSESLDVGIIWINDHHRNDPSSPWGGTKDSGLGRENGIDAFNEYTQAKSVVINCSDNDCDDSYYNENNKPFDWFVDGSNVRYS